jgi:hypothetical protein
VNSQAGANGSGFVLLLLFSFFCEHGQARRFAITIPWLSYCWKTGGILFSAALQETDRA